MTKGTNTRRSTGPKTAGGKYCVSRNARRHGLSARGAANPFARGRIEHLTEIFAGPEADTMRRELAAAVADAQIDLTSVRATKISVLEQINAVGTHTYSANTDWSKLFQFVARSGFEQFVNEMVTEEPHGLPKDDPVRSIEVFSTCATGTR
jgi:hypothetical protein